MYLLRREKSRKISEDNDYLRLFPVDDEDQMNKLTNILNKCFQVLYKNKNDTSWMMRYYNQYNENELVHEISRLEEIYKIDDQAKPSLTHVSFKLKNDTTFRKNLTCDLLI